MAKGAERRKIGLKYSDDKEVFFQLLRAQDQEDPRVRRAMLLAFAHYNPLATRQEFLDWFREHFPDTSDDGHCTMMYELFDPVPWSIDKKCPVARCMTHAHGIPEAIELFGFRYAGRVLQSHCKQCRRKDARARRQRHAEAIAEGRDPKDLRVKVPKPVVMVQVPVTDPKVPRIVSRKVSPALPEEEAVQLKEPKAVTAKKKLQEKAAKKLADKLQMEDAKRQRKKGPKKGTGRKKP